MTLWGLTFAPRPGVELVVRKTVPEKPFSAVIVIVDVPVVFRGIVTWVGFALMVKSGGGAEVLNVAA